MVRATTLVYVQRITTTAQSVSFVSGQCSRPPSRHRSTEAEQKLTHPLPRMVVARRESLLSGLW
jgi:hypothetical protein